MEGELISYGVRYETYIDNISEYGLCVKIPLRERERHYELDSDISFKLHIPHGESVDLQCTKRWVYQTSPASLIGNVGLEIVDPPQKYREFYWTMLLLLTTL
jgi:hypothetical protein